MIFSLWPKGPLYVLLKPSGSGESQTDSLAGLELPNLKNRESLKIER